MLPDAREKAKKFQHMIEQASSIAIIGHVNPDGDCIGSNLGLYNYIIDNYKDKKVDVYEESFSSSFKFLNGAKKIKRDTNGDSYELAISVDVSDVERLGKFKELYNTSISTACIDHHVSNKGFGDFCYIDPDASSACEALVDILDLEKISLNAAQSLYLGIVHDTGVFKYGATSRHTMEVAGALLEKGVDSAYIIDETFYKKSYKQNLLMSRVILESNLYEGGKVISGYISKEIFKEFKCTKQDTEGIVEQLRLTDGVEVAIFAYQLAKKSYKFSLRAKNYVDVNAIAQHFGGGGHIRAAGFSVEDYEKTMEELLPMVKEQLK